jgi:DNA end-binding protein Ku
MARAIWSGMLSFGLVSIPVRLYAGTRARRPAFHQFQKGTAGRIRNLRVNEHTGQVVEYPDVVKGADIGDGKYVLLGQEELDSIAPGRARLLDIQVFVDSDDIDPIYFSKAYFLGPGNDSALKSYALLRDAMQRSGKAAVCRFVMRSTEYLAAVLVHDDVLLLEILLFADEIRDPHREIDDLPGKVDLSPRELQMAGQLIDAMSGPWRPPDYRDNYRERVDELIETKIAHGKVRAADQAPAQTDVSSLTDALQDSLAAARAQPARKTARERERQHHFTQ